MQARPCWPPNIGVGGSVPARLPSHLAGHGVSTGHGGAALGPPRDSTTGRQETEPHDHESTID